MSPRMGRTGGAAARGFGKGTAVRGPRGIPTAVSATAVGTVANASNGKLDLVWTNGDAAAQTRIYNGATLLATANAGTTTKSFTDLIANTAYTLTVKHFKDSIESAGSNFSAATTFRYYADVISTGNVGGYTGYDIYNSVANGNNGTLDDITEFCALSAGITGKWLTVNGAVNTTITPTVASNIHIWAVGRGGVGTNGTGGGGGGSLVDVTRYVPANQQLNVYVNHGSWSQYGLAIVYSGQWDVSVQDGTQEGDGGNSRNNNPTCYERARETDREPNVCNASTQGGGSNDPLTLSAFGKTTYYNQTLFQVLATGQGGDGYGTPARAQGFIAYKLVPV